MREIAAGGVGVRRPGHAVRHHDQRVAHVPGLGPHQRLEPVLGVHAPGQLARATSPALNLMKFLDAEGNFDVASFRHAVEIVFTAQEILVGGVRLPDREDRRERAGVPPARAWATRTSAPC